MNIHFPLLVTALMVFPLAVFTNSVTGMLRFFGCLDSMCEIRFPLVSLFICLATTVISGSSGIVFTRRMLGERIHLHII